MHRIGEPVLKASGTGPVVSACRHAHLIVRPVYPVSLFTCCHSPARHGEVLACSGDCFVVTVSNLS